jgi:hypothetical protein
MSLKFLLKISRYGNLYFFIQNLSEWHISNRKEYNEVWHKELSFPSEADSCLQAFKKIHEQYSFGEKYLGRLFFMHDDPWPEVELMVGKNDTTNIKNIFTTLEPYFNRRLGHVEAFGDIVRSDSYLDIGTNVAGNIALCIGCELEAMCIGGCLAIKSDKVSGCNGCGLTGRNEFACDFIKRITHAILSDQTLPMID